METSKTKSSESLFPLITTGVALAGIAGTAMALSGPQEQPKQPVQPESFTEQVQESAQTPYDPATDELVINGIKVKPANANRNNPSEAVLGSEKVQEFVAQHPDESSSITTSAMSLPSDAKEAGIVLRDVDHDGDTDAVAVELETK
jgi:hypothetical protein